MKFYYQTLALVCASLLFFNCSDDDETLPKTDDSKEVPPPVNGSPIVDQPVQLNTNFNKIADIAMSEQGVPEISAYDAITQQVFSTNTEAKKVEVIDISDIDNPQLKTAIDITPFGGNLNSVATHNRLLAIAIEGNDKVVNLGRIVFFYTNNLTTPVINVEAGFLPDMVTFSPDGKYILAANEGEPNKENTIDPKG